MLWEWEGLLGESEVILDGEVGRGVPLGGRPQGRRGRGGREGGNGQLVEKKAARMMSHQNLVVCLDDSLEDKFSGMKRELIEKLLRRLMIGRKKVLFVKVLGFDNWMIGAELMSERLSFERELLGEESLSL